MPIALKLFVRYWIVIDQKYNSLFKSGNEPDKESFYNKKNVNTITKKSLKNEYYFSHLLRYTEMSLCFRCLERKFETRLRRYVVKIDLNLIYKRQK